MISNGRVTDTQVITSSCITYYRNSTYKNKFRKFFLEIK